MWFVAILLLGVIGWILLSCISLHNIEIDVRNVIDDYDSDPLFCRFSCEKQIHDNARLHINWGDKDKEGYSLYIETSDENWIGPCRDGSIVHLNSRSFWDVVVYKIGNLFRKNSYSGDTCILVKRTGVTVEVNDFEYKVSKVLIGDYNENYDIDFEMQYEFTYRLANAMEKSYIKSVIRDQFIEKIKNTIKDMTGRYLQSMFPKKMSDNMELNERIRSATAPMENNEFSNELISSKEFKEKIKEATFSIIQIDQLKFKYVNCHQKEIVAEKVNRLVGEKEKRDLEEEERITKEKQAEYDLSRRKKEFAQKMAEQEKEQEIKDKAAEAEFGRIMKKDLLDAKKQLLIHAIDANKEIAVEGERAGRSTDEIAQITTNAVISVSPDDTKVGLLSMDGEINQAHDDKEET